MASGGRKLARDAPSRAGHIDRPQQPPVRGDRMALLRDVFVYREFEGMVTDAGQCRGGAGAIRDFDDGGMRPGGARRIMVERHDAARVEVRMAGTQQDGSGHGKRSGKRRLGQREPDSGAYMKVSVCSVMAGGRLDVRCLRPDSNATVNSLPRNSLLVEPVTSLPCSSLSPLRI